MKERSTVPRRSPKDPQERNTSDKTRNIPANERATSQSQVPKSERPHTEDSLVGKIHTSRREDQSRREGAENGVQTYHNGCQRLEDAPQLQRWAYEVSDANITLSEKLEKSRWEAGRT